LAADEEDCMVRDVHLYHNEQQKRAVHHLMAADPVMAKVISKVGTLKEYYRQRTHFMSLCRIIAGQQLSYQAASNIWSRARKAAPRWTPAAISQITEDRFRRCGMSAAKAAAVVRLAKSIVAGNFRLKELGRFDDIEVMEKLQSMKGIGPWSVEMFLLFALNRPDVFSPGDAGLRRAIISLYAVEPDSYSSLVDGIAAQWRPYRSYACRYLWRWLDLRAEQQQP
jgi:DNA-3-methyladenine glycosylase II